MGIQDRLLALNHRVDEYHTILFYFLLNNVEVLIILRVFIFHYISLLILEKLFKVLFLFFLKKGHHKRHASTTINHLMFCTRATRGFIHATRNKFYLNLPSLTFLLFENI